MASSAEPDKLASSKANYLDLHCLQMQGISGFSRIRVKQLNVPHCGDPNIHQNKFSRRHMNKYQYIYIEKKKKKKKKKKKERKNANKLI